MAEALHPKTIWQATISLVVGFHWHLSLASTGIINFHLRWLDDLLAPEDPKLHGSVHVIASCVNARVLIAEVLEWQGQHKEAIRCAKSHTTPPSAAHAHSCSCIRLFTSHRF
jgi:hypothetical protein